MIRLAWRQLQYDKIKALLTALAIGSVIAVILVLEGFEQGQYFQLKQIILNRQADLVATQSGVTNFIAVRSSIPQLSRSEVESVPGVKIAHPITALPIIYNKGNILTPVYVIVYDTKGGPSSIISGRNFQKGNEIVIDESLAKKYDIQLGDSFYVTDFEFTVSGITREAAFMMPFAFINYDGMLDLFIESQIAPDLSTFPLLSYMLIEVEPGFDRELVRKSIEGKAPFVDVLTPGDLAINDVNMGKVFFAPIMGLLISVGYIIGLLVVGLIMFADVHSRIRDFAVLKALGFPLNKLFTAVLAQSFLLLVIAIPVGILTALSLAALIETLSPVYLIRIFETSIFIQTIIASFAFAFIGALLPLRTVAKSDPVMAFQGT